MRYAVTVAPRAADAGRAGWFRVGRRDTSTLACGLTASAMTLSGMHAAPAGERELVRRAQAGDPRAFEALIAEHDHGLRALAFRLLEDRAAMQDAMQDAYVSAYRAIGSFTGSSAFGTWLYRIVYNACTDELRRRPRRAYVELEDSHEHVDPAPGLAEAAATRTDLAAALAGLSPDHRAIVLLIDAQGFGYDEAAEALGISAGTVASRLNRARAALRPALADPTNEDHA